MAGRSVHVWVMGEVAWQVRENVQGRGLSGGCSSVACAMGASQAGEMGVGGAAREGRHDSHRPRVAGHPELISARLYVVRSRAGWLADITYIAAREGWLYLAVVLDLFSRRIVGWSVSTCLSTDIASTLSTWPSPGTVFHRDSSITPIVAASTRATAIAGASSRSVRCRA